MGKRVLVIDDEMDLVTLLKFILEKYGLEVITAGNGQEAIDYLEGELTKPEPKLPNVIVTDIMMPVMDGYSMINRLREENEFRNIPIIIMTAKGQIRDLFAAVPNIPVFIEKPFEPKLLKTKIDEVLG
ncbi:MAG: response regulator [Elusimicrobiaceae bacterium]|jgi:CheY-like chemotaxis protein